MGYILKIGQLSVGIEKDGLQSRIYHEVETVKHENAPAFGEPTDFTNGRWPSYIAWEESVKMLNLYELFYNKDTGIIREYPENCVPLVKEHKKIIDKAYKEFYEKYPNTKAGYNRETTEMTPNAAAVRLEWLKYWVDWALENCSMPVFYSF